MSPESKPRRGAGLRAPSPGSRVPGAPLPLLAALLVAAAGQPGAAAGQEPPLPLPRLDGPIVVDGVPDEAAWGGVEPLPLTMYAPVHRGTPRERTEIRVAYDDRFLYAAGWFYDADPDGVRINSLYRDRWNGDDAFAIYVDAFNDNLNAKWFGTTPAGMRFDWLVSDDGATLNGSWDAFWDAAATVTDEGWFAEVRIPFSTLGFQVDASGSATMGLTVTRLVSRTGERVTFPDIDPSFEFRRPSVARDVRLEGVESPTPLYLTPYVLTGVDRAVRPSGSGWVGDTDVSPDVGGDLRYAMSGNLTLDVTVNTDFAQVEADDEQVSFDRFSLFFPEKRRFFQEQSGLFDFALGGGNRLFHSRRIGLDDERQPVPVLGGVRLVGRLSDVEIGILDMQTGSAGAQPSENFGAARIRSRVANPYSSVGALLTTRLGGGRHNVAGGVDGVFRLFGDHWLTTRWATTWDQADAADPGPGEPADQGLAERSAWVLSWDRRAQRGLAWSLDVARTGGAFAPDVGFLRRSDVTSVDWWGNWFIYTDAHPVLRRVYPGGLAFSTFRNEDGSLESGTYAVWVQWDTKAGGGGWIEPKLFVEDVRAPFSIGGEVDIPAARYEYADLQVVWRMPVGRRLRTTVDARAGTFFDGNRVQVVLQPTWNVSPNLELGADYQWSRLRFPDRGQGTDVHVARVRIRTALDARASGNAFVQYNSTTDRMDVNVRLRYNFAEGEDLWLVFNEGLVTDRYAGPAEPLLPRSLTRAVVVKYTHTFGF